MTRDTDDANASTGADDRLETTRLAMPQLNCPWNARRTADHLQRVPGVVEASLPRSDTVVVRYDPTRTSEAAITDAVERPGSGGGRKSTPDGRESVRSRRRSSGCQCGCSNRPR